MSNRLYRLAMQILDKLIQLDDLSIRLSDKVVSFIQILGALLNLSYLQPKDQHNYIQIISLFVRPQQYINSTIVGYFLLIVNALYVFGIFFNIPGKGIISLYGGLMVTNFLNFCLEISLSPLCFILQPTLIIISAINQLFLLETLDVENKNFNYTKVSYSVHFIWILQIVQSMLWYYDSNMITQNLIGLLKSSLQLISADNFIIASIQLYTIIYAFIITLGFANDLTSLLVIFPILIRITQQIKKTKNKTYLHNIGKYKKQESILIQISLLILNKQYQKALYQLQEMQELSIYYEAKKEKLKQKCLRQIQTTIFANQSSQYSLLDAINNLIEVEERSFYHITQIKILIQQKLLLLQNKNEENYEVYYEYLDKITVLENVLRQQYQENSTLKNKAILLFFYSEIMNNFHQARLISNQNNPIQCENYDLNKLSYLISKYDKGITVSGISNNSVLCLDSSQGIESYIPPGIREHHNSIIEKFIETGVSKYAKQFNACFIAKDNDNYMSSIDFGFNAIITDELKFITFLQISPEQPMAMILDSQLKITCISESLSYALNITQFDFQNFEHCIRQFVPQYSETENYQENLELILSDSEQDCPFVTTINQRIKFINNIPVYYILIFECIRKSNAKQKSFSQLNFQSSIIEHFTNQQLQYDQKTKSELDYFLQGNIAQEEQIDVPYYEQDIRQQYLNDLIELQQLDECINIQSPDNKKQSRLKLIRKQSSASRLKKQQSIIIEQEDQILIKHQQISQNSLAKDFLSEYYAQHSKIENKFIFSFLLSLFVTQAFFLQQTIKVNLDINQLMDNLEVLDFSQLCFQPIENNLLVIFSMSEYSLFYLMQLITYQQLLQVIQFPSNQIVIGYDQIYSNFNQLFKQPLLQNTLDDNELVIYQYTNSSKEESYNMNLRNAFGTLLKFQYDIVMDFKVNGKVNADSAYIYYTFKNYLPLKQLVRDLHKDLLEDTMILVESNIQMITILFVISAVALTIPYLLSYYYFVGIVNQISRYYNIVLQLPQDMKDEQIQKYKKLISQINEDYKIVGRFQYNEQSFVMVNQNQNQSQKRFKVQNRLKFRGLSWKIGYLVLYIVILLKSGISLYLNKEYLQGYKEIATFYKALSDLSIDICTMYSAREVLLFRSSFPYLQEDSIQQLLQVVENGLNRTKQFLEKQIIYDKVILSDEFQEYYDSLSTGDLCAQLSDELQQQTKSFCQQLFNGNMKNGLFSTLTIIINNLQTELNFSQFKQRTSIQFYDLEGPYLISGILTQLYQIMRQDMHNQTYLLLKLMNIVGIGLLSLLGVLLLFSKFLIFNRLSRMFEVSKKFISFIPIKMLLIDEGMERYVKNLMCKNNLS